MAIDRDYDTFKLSSKELLNKRLIDFLFKTCDRGCAPLEDIGEHTEQTGYFRMTMFAKSMMRKYMPTEVHSTIKELYVLNKTKKDAIDTKDLTEQNKKLNKKKIDDQTATDVLEILMTILFESSINVEHTEGALTGNHEHVIQLVRNKEPVKLYGNHVKSQDDVKP